MPIILEACEKVDNITTKFENNILQGMNPRARMMLQQRAQLPPGAQPGVQGVQDPSGGVPQSSPLLAQHLSGRPPMPQQAPNQPVTSQAQQPQQPQQNPQEPPQPPAGEQSTDELGGLDNEELGDLGMGEEDILGMSENFDIMEFADALDDLEKMPEDEKTSDSPTTSTSQPSAFQGQASGTNVTAPTQGQNIRAPPPPPYPGPQGQTPTSKVWYFNLTYFPILQYLVVFLGNTFYHI